MDLESIKVLADTATQLTGEAKQVFVWWLLGKEVLSTVLQALLYAAFFFLVYRLGTTFLSSLACISYIKQKRDEFDIGVPGPLTESERARTTAEIERRLKEANK